MANNKKKVPAGAAAAFVAGAAIGTAAGLMTKQKNRRKVVKAAKKVRSEAKAVAKKGLDKAKEVVDQVRGKREAEPEAPEA